MIEKDDLFEFESTGRTFKTSMDGISVTKEGQVRYGYDGHVEIIGEDGDPDYELEFSDEEKKELAVYMIDKWSKWAGMSTTSPVIELTEEWLLKFGFEFKENCYWKGFNYSKVFCIYPSKGYGYRFSTQTFMVFIKDIHQLQNLFFVLTGEELKAVANGS